MGQKVHPYGFRLGVATDWTSTWYVENKDYSKYLLTDLASNDSMFAATGVTDGSMLSGVKIIGEKAYTESIVMRSETGTVRVIKATHNLRVKS